MKNKGITVKTPDGEFNAYLAKPSAGVGSCIVVIQEIFGVNDVMRSLADYLAKEGYLAVVPDLFWRLEPGIELTDKTETDWAKAMDLYQKFDEDKGVKDLISTLTTVRSLPECVGPVGTVGYCLGGKLAYLMATRSDADCNVSFYGVGIEKNLNEASSIKRPLLMHLAEEDKFVSKDAQNSIKQAFKDNDLVTIHSYPGVNHAFARVGGEHYNKEAADLANSRTLGFFKQQLTGVLSPAG